MAKLYLSIVVVVFTLYTANAQEVIWLDADQSTTNHQIAFDAKGNNWRFLQHGTNYQLGDTLLKDAGWELVKTNADGTIEFIQPAGLSGMMRSDLNGNMYVLARYGSEVIIQGKKLEKPASMGMAILKYNSKGRLIWAKTYSATGSINLIEMTVVKHNLKLAFNYETSISSGNDTLQASQAYGLAVAYVDSAGNTIKHTNNILDNQLPYCRFAFAQNGNYTLGYSYRGSVEIDGQIYSTSGSNQNVFFATYDQNDNFKWMQNCESVQPSIGFSTRITTMAYAGGDSLIVGGVFKDRMRVNGKWYYGGSEEGFFVRYTSDGNFLWIKQVPMEGPQRIIPLANGKWVTGATLGKYDDPSTDSCQVGYNDDRSIYVATFDKDGACLDIKTFGGSRDFFLRGGLDAHSNGQISLTGRAFSSFYYGNNLQYRVTSGDLNFTMILGQCVAPKIQGLGASEALCEGETVTLRPQFFGQVQNLAWLKDGAKVNRDYYPETYTIDSISNASAGDYWLKLTGACGSDSMKLSVDKPNPKPGLTLTANETFCEGNKGEAIVNFTGTPPFTYGVLVDDKEQLHTTNNMADTLTFNGAVLLKTVSVDDNYCSVQLGNDSVQFNMQKLPVSEFTVNVTDFSVRLRSQATFYDKLSWDYGDGNGVDDELYPRHTYTSNGTYTITLIAENQCGIDSFTQNVVIDAVSVGNLEKVELSLYPNPVSETLTLERGEHSTFSYRIFTSLGQLAEVGRSDNGNNVVDVSTLERGSYYIMTYTDNVLTGTGHFVVE